jgi:hypothetical protein
MVEAMKIKSATKEELALLIMGLRAVWVADRPKLHKRMLKQLEDELEARHGCRLADS